MEVAKNSYQGSAGRIYSTVKEILEVIVVLLKFFQEILISTIKLFTGEAAKDVSGEIVLITGTGHGIGRELALQYVSLGATVVCVDINEKGNEETIKEANSLEIGTARGYVCDISNRDEVLKLARKVQIEVGPVSVLINNAGIMPTHKLEQHTSEEIHKIFDVNVFSQFWTLEAFLPHMKAKNRGHIVAMSSIAGVVGLSNLVPYCASKFAVRGLMEALFEELRENGHGNMIRTTVISPYMVNTGLCKKPKVKFPSLLGLLDPKHVAACIIDAQRKNYKEITVPKGFWPFTNFCRLLPMKCSLILKDYIDSGVESDL